MFYRRGAVVNMLVQVLETLGVVHEHQHVINRRIAEMSDNLATRMTEMEAKLDRVGAAITKEVKQLADAVTAVGGKLTPQEVARFDAIGSRLDTMAGELEADDGTSGTGTGPATTS